MLPRLPGRAGTAAPVSEGRSEKIIINEREKIREAVATNAAEMVSEVPAVPSNRSNRLQLPSLRRCGETRVLLRSRNESLKPGKPQLRGMR